MVETEDLTENCVLPECQKCCEPPCTKFIPLLHFYLSVQIVVSPPSPRTSPPLKCTNHMADFTIYIYFQKLLQPN
uniref:HBV preS1-transactivated protein 3 binding protein 1 n=2 Tax=Homininae TaxID=207598 RepID=Q06DD2_HUMAN|nr:HBV preS1-transactivated protein 3 binding protein 1 [Homo sapiens]